MSVWIVLGRVVLIVAPLIVVLRLIGIEISRFQR